MSEPSTVTVYCASSRISHPEYREVAGRLGELLAEAGITIVCGGGAVGSMGALADGALEHGGRVEGVLPRFMHDLEWGHPRLSDLHIVSDLHERKRLMIDRSDAVVALPGGCGTFEELFEAITWKRLGLWSKPIILVNTRGFYDPAVALLERAVEEHFMDDRHRDMWQVVEGPEDVLGAIRSAPAWSDDAREFAVP
ncbi:MAG: TIGR00730 family Rossman fold protein [Deltaproteobacteria bacterium]|nr:TIGR00730 family Rossman fold protein [Deltaproteobacteria bacterium]MBW2447789.1 TIGR00730 family Rossman fold protein [Deltaproteobacteria bacterium]